MLGRLFGFFLAAYQNRHGRDSRPRFLTYTTTFGCNARCIMCDSWKLPTKGDLTIDEIEHIFRQLPRMDAVRLTGGEPFVRRDLADIAELARRYLRPLVLHVTTNGFLTDRVTEFCEKRNRATRLQLLVSVDGVGEKHNKIRGSSLAWDSVMETIDALAPRQKELNLRLRINQTIVDAEGVDHYRRLRDLLKQRGVFNNVVVAYDVSATYSQERELNVAPTQMGEFTTFGDFGEDTIRELLAEVESDLGELPWTERMAKRYYLRGIRNRLLSGRGTPNPKCVALNSHLRIFPNGDVPTCQFNTKTVGNLREQSFEELWRGLLASEGRRWVADCPGCWAECEVLPSAIYTMNIARTAWSR